jgi:ABC-type nitrate/sulfonate/bicarbonate transport system substrate-binding protein
MGLCRWAVAVGLLALAMRTTSAAELTTFRVGTPEASAFMFAVVDVGIKSGIFAKHGLDVEKIDFQGGAKLQQGIVSNAVEATVAGSSDIKFIAKGVPALAVAEIAGPPVDMALIVRADASVTTPAQLKGAKIGVTTVGSLTDWLAREFARQQGWGENGVEPVALGSIRAGTTALLVKQVEAFVGSTETGLVLEHEGRAKILIDYGKVLPGFLTHLMYASTAAMNDHPDALKRFIAGWFDTVHYMRANKARTVEIVSEAIKLPPEIVARAYDIDMTAITDNGTIDRVAFEGLKKAVLPEDIKVTDAQLYTEKFLP